MVIAVDFDGVVVDQSGAYADVVSPLHLLPGAKAGLLSLKAAGHVLLLYSARACLSLRQSPDLDPLVRSGARRVNRPQWERDRPLNEARYQQMLRFVATELPGVFDAVDDGTQGKPAGVDLFIDDRATRFGFGARGLGWMELAQVYGSPYYGETLSVADRLAPAVHAHEGLSYATLLHRWQTLPGSGVQVTPIATTAVGPLLVVRAGAVGGPLAVIVAGQHGDETAGPLALYQYADEVVSYARQRGVRLLLFPCANPEGFAVRQHHNLANETPNSVLEYEASPGKWRPDMPVGKTPLAFRMGTQSPETRAILAVGDMLVNPPPAVFLDLHQDSLLGERQWFAYTFGDRRPYLAAGASVVCAQPMVNRALHNLSWTDIALATDDGGLVKDFFDGSFPDWAWKRGASMSLCVEVTTRGSTDEQMDIARAWVLSVIDQAAAGATAKGQAR